jgi:curved DNA-binding protein CbpA
MKPDQDPYETLNVPLNASESQIKTAYRKLALKFHPDRQSSSEEKEKCTQIFAKIGNAYEILSDKDRRQEYDRFGTVGGDDGLNSSNTGANRASGATGNHPFMNDPFFRSSFFDMSDHGFFNRRDSRRNSQQYHHAGFAGFSDPFDLFRSVFEDDFSFGGGTTGGSNRGNNSQFNNYQSSHQSFHSNGNQQNSQHDPHQDIFGLGGFPTGFGGFGMMGNMARHMNAMNSMMLNQQSQSFTNGNNNGSFFSSSSSSSFSTNANGESIRTTTRVINGKRQTVTEKTIRKSDGTLEKITETTGDDDFPTIASNRGAIANGSNTNHTRHLLENKDNNDTQSRVKKQRTKRSSSSSS